MKITSVKEASAGTGVKVCVLGFAGAGKTRLLATLPGHGLVCSAESGLLSIASVPHAGTIDVAEIEAVEDLREVYSALQQPEHGYDWVALDSVSEIAEQVLTSEKSKTKDPRQAYGALIDSMGSLLRAFRDLKGVDVYFSAKAQRVKDEATGRISVELMLPGAKLAQSIPYIFDEVLFLSVVQDKETGETSRWLQTAADAKVDCKDRSGVLDPFEPADLGAIIAKIKSGGGAPTDRGTKIEYTAEEMAA